MFSGLSVAQQPVSPPNASPTPAQTTEQTENRQTSPQPASTSTPQAPADNQKQERNQKGGKASSTSNDRLFYTLPNFLSMENAGKLPPMTTKEKFAVVTRGSFDYTQVPWYGFLAGLNQAQDSEPGFGQGAAGYGKRFGASFADGTIENYMTSAILPSILHQDPRFYQLGKGGFLHRTFYAASRNFITRSDSGRTQFNYSEIVGGGLSAAISTYSYHPKSTFISTPTNPHKFIGSDRTLENTVSVWGTQLGYDTITIIVKEFWPDIHRKFSHKPKIDSAGSPNPHP